MINLIKLWALLLGIQDVPYNAIENCLIIFVSIILSTEDTLHTTGNIAKYVFWKYGTEVRYRIVTSQDGYGYIQKINRLILRIY